MHFRLSSKHSASKQKDYCQKSNNHNNKNEQNILTMEARVKILKNYYKNEKVIEYQQMEFKNAEEKIKEISPVHSCFLYTKSCAR